MAGPFVRFQTASVEYPDDGLGRFLALVPLAMVQLRVDGTIVHMNAPCADLLVPLSCDGRPVNLFDLLQPMASDLALRVREFTAPQGRICEGLHLRVEVGHAGRCEPQVLKLDLVKLDGERLVAMIDDVSLAFRRDVELRRGQAWIQNLITGIADHALLTLDPKGVIQEWSPGVRDVTGFDADATIGQPYCDIFCTAQDSQPGRVRRRLQDADDHGWSVEEGWMRRANGEHYWASWLIAPLHAPEASGPASGRRGYSLIIRDIGDRPESGDALRSSVLFDPVTGLLGQRAFFDSAAMVLERGVQSGMCLSVVRFNVDDFPALADAHGPAAAASVLRHLAAGLSATFRQSDIVARVGAHAFVVLMPDASVAQAESTAQQLCVRLEACTLRFDGTVVAYTVSGGVAGGAPSGTGPGPGLDELLQRADAAMYSAKSQGRNGIARWHDAG